MWDSLSRFCTSLLQTNKYTSGKHLRVLAMCLHAEKKEEGILSPCSFETDKAQREKPFSYNFCPVFALMY